MAKQFFGGRFARPRSVRRSSFSVPTVTAVNVIAASPAEDGLVLSNIVAPTAAIRAALREETIIARVK
jgi:hypothetical protein